VMVVLRVGLGPGSHGKVLTSLRLPLLGGNIYLAWNFMNAFLTGKIPADLRFLNPKTRILMSLSAYLISLLMSN
jgi:hypothetical protein